MAKANSKAARKGKKRKAPGAAEYHQQQTAGLKNTLADVIEAGAKRSRERAMSQFLDAADEMDTALHGMSAIMDCAKTLAALERATAPELKAGEMLTGAGYAAGYVCCDDSLPDLLYVGVCLADRAKKQADTMAEAARALDAGGR